MTTQSSDIFERVGARATPAPGNERASVLLRPLLRLLAEGVPIPPERLAAAVGQPVSEVVNALRAVPGPVEFDRCAGWMWRTWHTGGDNLGWHGRSLPPLPHKER